MAVRNSWVEVHVDGKREPLASGPRSADGGMKAQFYVRDGGSIVRSATVYARVLSDGTLALSVFDPQGNEVFTHKTKR